jgi:hypothetical protein
MSLFDDSISLLLIGNTYFIFIVFGVTWLSILIHTIAGDFSIFQTILDLGDSNGCRVRVGLIFVLTSAFFHSFLLQALRSYFKVIFNSSLNSKKLYCLSLNHIFTYIILISISWLISILTVIPAFTIFDVFTYFPEQYHCLIPFTNIRGMIYSFLSTYLIPVLIIIYIHCRLIIYVHYAFNFNHTLRARREIRIVKRILTIFAILSFSGLPTAVFIFLCIITGKHHPMADRIHELSLAIIANIVTLGFAVLNSLANLWPRTSAVYR